MMSHGGGGDVTWRGGDVTWSGGDVTWRGGDVAWRGRENRINGSHLIMIGLRCLQEAILLQFKGCDLMHPHYMRGREGDEREGEREGGG